MKTTFIFLLLISSSMSLCAQPGGGGGGIRIINIYSLFNEPLTKDNPDLEIRIWQLSEKTYKPLKELIIGSSEAHWGSSFPWQIYLLPYTTHKGKRINTPNQRLQLIYEKDTMIIDFIGVASENGAGYSDELDHIDFTPGHFVYHREPWKTQPEIWDHPQTTEEQRNQIRAWLRKGIDGETIYMLNGIKTLTYTLPAGQHDLLHKRIRPVCHDTLAEAGYRWLCYEAIRQDSGHLSITTRTQLFPSDSLPCYKLLFYNTSDYRLGLGQERQFPEELAAPGIYRLLKQGLYLNGAPYTGCIRMAFRFSNAGISAHYGGYSLEILYYSNGVFAGSTVLTDVSLDTERAMIRPTR